MLGSRIGEGSGQYGEPSEAEDVMDSIALSLMVLPTQLLEGPLPGEQQAMLSMIVLEAALILLAALAAALAAGWLKRLPTFHVCPTCLHSTQPVQLALALRPLRRYVTRRWCPNCAWEGTGRKAPYYLPGTARRAHRSGFRWASPGEEPTP
jgi:hypothetical protein